MSAAKSPVEKRIDDLRDLWLEAAQDPDVRLVVWRIPGNADRMLAAFFEALKQSEVALTPDYFIRFDAGFDTGFGYSRALIEALQLGYIASRNSLKEQGVSFDWRGAHAVHAESATGVLQGLASFADHYGDHLRNVVAVLMPAAVTSCEALEQWLDAALNAPIPGNVRVAVVDYVDNPRWQPLASRHGKAVRVIDAPIDMFDLARATAAQSGAAGPQTAYRQLLADTMTLLDKGTAAQTAARADRALQMAQRQQWPDQQVVLHMIVAGAYLKEQDFPSAIKRYRDAYACAEVAETARHPAGTNLMMQALFGEAGVWLAAAQPSRAAAVYAHAAQVARRIPHAMFALEGWRMAGFCLARDGQREPARDHYLQALGEARDMAATDRPMTTLPLLLQDMLRLQDASRVEAIEKTAVVYQSDIADAHARAEAQAGKLGQQPAPEALEKIDAALTARFEASFGKLGEDRERLIGGGDEYFRKVVAIGRDYLHASWSGLPEVKHPLDKDQPEWSHPPQYAVLPDPVDLLDARPVHTMPPAIAPALVEDLA